MSDFLAIRSPDPAALWASGRFTLRVRGPMRGSIDVRWPYALIGRAPGCDVVLDDPGVASRHVYLHLDSRGLFAVDLASGLGSRIGPDKRLSAWLTPGDVVRVGSWQVELADVVLDRPDPQGPGCADPLDGTSEQPLTDVTLYPERGSPLVLHSELVFVGRSPACGICIDDPAAEPVHCVLVRGRQAAYVVDLGGRDVAINGRCLHAPAALRDGDELTVGTSRLECRVQPPERDGRHLRSISAVGPPAVPHVPEVFSESLIPEPPSHLLAPGSQGQLVTWLLGVLQATQGELLRRQVDFQHEMQQAVRRLQSEQASALSRQLEKVDNLHREVAGLREEVRRRYGAIDLNRRPDPPRAALRNGNTAPAPADDGATAAWLMQRIHQVNQESQAALRNRRRRK